jgi:DEAD/DEAH box helicase domain-containing protein
MLTSDQLEAAGWTGVWEHTLPGKEAKTFALDDLRLDDSTADYLASAAPGGVYGHQREAIAATLADDDVCISTDTASGKSLCFYAAALELLAKEPTARILALYPMRALAREQERKWSDALRHAAGSVKVGRIDGSVRGRGERDAILDESNVIVMTPDVMHAWLLPNVGNKSARKFLSMTRLVVVDEVHSYTGVFGSNAAYLFRRLRHACTLVGQDPAFIAASATIKNPAGHMRDLVGKEFRIVGPELDTSPQYARRLQLLKPVGTGEQLTAAAALLTALGTRDRSRFLAFVDSRKQAEHLSAIAARGGDAAEEDGEEAEPLDVLLTNRVLPYRAGYEQEDRQLIEQRLTDGSLDGVVSTSALELGIDIPGIDVGVLFGVPRSEDSFRQRIGRVGRHTPGDIYVLLGDAVADKAVFHDPESILRRPVKQSALYLDNPRMAYIHALCLARDGGEHDQAAGALDPDGALLSEVEWPEGFLELCARERSGSIPRDLQQMKMAAGDSPQYEFPLRGVEAQLKVESIQHGGRMRLSGLNTEIGLGSLSLSQVLREAYPGAVYYYATNPYRVVSVSTRRRTVSVRREKRYTTTPRWLPTTVYPNLNDGNVHAAWASGDLALVECSLQVREQIIGYTERRGSSEFAIDYPTDDDSGIAFRQRRFARNYFTTGVVLRHPAMDDMDADTVNGLASLVYEAFLDTKAFERHDLGMAADRMRATWEPLNQGNRFIAVYDSTYGSLRLSGRLAEDGALIAILDHAMAIAQHEENSESLSHAIRVLRDELDTSRRRLTFDDDAGSALTSDSERVVVIAPGSVATNIHRDNQEFQVQDVFYSPQGLRYRGVHSDAEFSDGTTIVLEPSSLDPIPGVTRHALYDLNLGDIVDSPEAQVTHAADGGSGDDKNGSCR